MEAAADVNIMDGGARPMGRVDDTGAYGQAVVRGGGGGGGGFAWRRRTRKVRVSGGSSGVGSWGGGGGGAGGGGGGEGEGGGWGLGGGRGEVGALHYSSPKRHDGVRSQSGIPLQDVARDNDDDGRRCNSQDLIDFHDDIEQGARQGLTLIHFSAQLEPCLTLSITVHSLHTP